MNTQEQEFKCITDGKDLKKAQHNWQKSSKSVVKSCKKVYQVILDLVLPLSVSLFLMGNAHKIY